MNSIKTFLNNVGTTLSSSLAAVGKFLGRYVNTCSKSPNEMRASDIKPQAEHAQNTTNIKDRTSAVGHQDQTPSVHSLGNTMRLIKDKLTSETKDEAKPLPLEDVPIQTSATDMNAAALKIDTPSKIQDMLTQTRRLSKDTTGHGILARQNLMHVMTSKDALFDNFRLQALAQLQECEGQLTAQQLNTQVFITDTTEAMPLKEVLSDFTKL